MSREAGQALVEAVALVPACLACALALVDCGIVVADRIAVSQAAARGAAAQLAGSDPAAAARASLPGGLRAAATVRSSPARVEVRVESRARIARIAGHPVVHVSSVQLKETAS